MELSKHTDCYGCGDERDDRIQPVYEWDEKDRRIVGSVVFGNGTQGPPGHVHGGALATALDEAMGAAAWLSGHTCLAVSLTVNYREMVPLGTVLRMEARVEEIRGRKVYAVSTLTDERQKVVADCKGLFVVVSPERMGNVVPGTHAPIDRLHRWLDRQRSAGNGG